MGYPAVAFCGVSIVWEAAIFLPTKPHEKDENRTEGVGGERHGRGLTTQPPKDTTAGALRHPKLIDSGGLVVRKFPPALEAFSECRSRGAEREIGPVVTGGRLHFRTRARRVTVDRAAPAPPLGFSGGCGRCSRLGDCRFLIRLELRVPGRGRAARCGEV